MNGRSTRGSTFCAEVRAAAGAISCDLGRKAHAWGLFIFNLALPEQIRLSRAGIQGEVTEKPCFQGIFRKAGYTDKWLCSKDGTISAAQ